MRGQHLSHRFQFSSRREIAASSVRQSGFTIVELLIVIVVIGILAAIIIVAYNGITAKANAASAQAAANQAAQKVLAYMATNADQVPADLSSAAISATASTNVRLFTNTSANPQQFCVMANVGSASYYVDNVSHSSPTSGSCQVANLVSNPNAELNAANVNPMGSDGMTISRDTSVHHSGAAAFKMVEGGGLIRPGFCSD